MLEILEVLEVLAYLVIFAVVIYLLGHTADNYFSPVLAAICSLLDMPPDVAGVTFLAFGNGAPDVFSSFVAMTNSKDREASLMVGMGLLLGATMVTITVVIAGVVYAKPTPMRPVPFSRDIMFLLIAHLMILGSTTAGAISLWGALSFVGLYVIYVAFVFKGPGGAGTPRTPEAAGIGDYGSDGSTVGSDDHGACARWITTPTASEECAPWASKPSNKSVLVEAVAAKSDRRNDQGRDTENGSTAAATPPATPGSAGEKGSRGRTLSGVVDWALGRGNKINDDHFGAEEKGGPAEERTLLANHFRGRGNGGSGSGSGGESPVVGDARSRVAGSTISLFLEDDDSAASWLAQRQWGGRAWFRIACAESGGQGSDMSEGAIEEPLLGEASDSGGEGCSGGGNLRDSFGSREIAESTRTDFTRRFERAWTSLQWNQWRLRRQLRRELGNSEFLQYPWYRQAFHILELPFILARNATIPPVEADSWSQLQATVATTLFPVWMVGAFGMWRLGFLGLPPKILTWGAAAPLVAVPTGVAVWLTTHRRRMPSDRWYRLGLAMVAFGSCVAWIYVLAEIAVDLIEVIGATTGIPDSILGITFLAWGSTCGDMVTNLAVAKAGYPSMAVAASYGGPVFNLLLGLGLPTVWNSIRNFPEVPLFHLDPANLLSVYFGVIVLVATLTTVMLAGFQFPARAPLILVVTYIVYIIGAILTTLLL